MTASRAILALALAAFAHAGCAAPGTSDTASSAVAPALGTPNVAFEVPDWSGRWYKGNTHAHTTESDGDSSPEYVARWYKDNGYDFLVLTDHNVFTDPADLAHLTDSTFLLIAGEEVTSSFDGASVHVNGLNIPHVIEARRAESLVATIQANVDAVREVDGVPHINHPNFQWAFGAEELRQIENDRLLEIWNGHPTVHNEGGGGVPSLVEVWDILLTGGKRIYGIAVDDAHHFQGEFSRDRANPGRGWISIRADALEPAALMVALEEGHFYASTGVELHDVVVTPSRMEVHIEEDRDFRYTTVFYGAQGRILATRETSPAVFDLREDVGYVRAEITNSRGDVAWVQPVFVERR
ncbi:MAG: CehA/McbA family metallohydrolase [Longimicrobiales bacterium]|nr:CehA/McbA family metallohydrolase [Longimicrobiales bacterium]